MAFEVSIRSIRSHVNSPAQLRSTHFSGALYVGHELLVVSPAMNLLREGRFQAGGMLQVLFLVHSRSAHLVDRVDRTFNGLVEFLPSCFGETPINITLDAIDKFAPRPEMENRCRVVMVEYSSKDDSSLSCTYLHTRSTSPMLSGKIR